MQNFDYMTPTRLVFGENVVEKLLEVMAAIGKRVLLGAQSGIAGCTYIDDDCKIWAKASVNKDLYVAKGTVLYALSALDKSIHEEGTTLFGVPAIDAQTKWKELIYVKKLPVLFQELNELKKKLETE